jgi:hypothetical protein
MRKTSFFLFMSACSALAQDAWQQKPGFINSFVAGNAAQIQVRIAFMAEPTRDGLDALLGANGITINDPSVVNRYVIDKVHHRYFGYDISAEATSVAGQYRVTVAPLTWMPPKEQGLLVPLLLSKYPKPQIMNETDTIKLDLLTTPDGKQKVADYIQVGKKPDPEEPPAATSKELAKDYTPDDGPIKFDFDYYTIWIGGEKYSSSTGSYSQPGATVWFYYPGQGRYILSLVPHDGFSKAGEIRDSAISFEAAGRQIEIRTMKSIIGDSPGAWNLYALHDPAFQPKNADSVQFGTDRLENLLPRH